MSIKRLICVSALVIFPICFLGIYLINFVYIGHGVRDNIPNFDLFLSLAILLGLEQIFVYKNAVSQKSVVFRDIASTLVNALFTGNVMRMVFVPFVLFFPSLLFGRPVFFALPTDLGPFWLQLILVLFFYGFIRYYIHRLQHIIPFLWELHSYHHGITDLRASNTLVSHPLDYSLRNILPALILGIVGFDPEAVFISASLLGTASIFSHCGANVSSGWLSYIFVTPELHRWHHAKVVPDGHKYSVNYGVGFILWDRILGTYYFPKKDGVPIQPQPLGHPDGRTDEKNYLKLLFLTRYWPKRLKLKHRKIFRLEKTSHEG